MISNKALLSDKFSAEHGVKSPRVRQLEFFIKTLVTVVLGSLGWIISHHFTSKRDAKNAKRQRRIEALSKAYDVLIRLGLDKGVPARRNHEEKVIEYTREFEYSVVMIHLYGNRKEIELANEMSRKLADEYFYSATDLVNELRRDIREEIGMEVHEDIVPRYVKNEVRDEALNKSIQPTANASAD